MKLAIISLLISILTVSCNKDNSTVLPENTLFSDTLNLKFIQKEEAASLLKREDNVSNLWNQLDIEVRLKEKGNKNDLLEFAAQQAREWTTEEIHFLRKSQDYINRSIQRKGLRFHYPKEARVLKSTMIEEDEAAGYTRDNYIVITEKILSRSDVNQLIAHEAFHVLTRNDPEFRKQMHNLIGFNILPHEVEFPQELRDRLITNPDVVRYDSYATFTINGKKTDCIMVTYADKPYDGEALFEYVKTGLVAIDRNQCKAIEKDGKAIIFSIVDATDFYDKIGKNTDYILDPEEILAENFCFLLTDEPNLPNQKLLQEMALICK